MSTARSSRGQRNYQRSRRSDGIDERQIERRGKSLLWVVFYLWVVAVITLLIAAFLPSEAHAEAVLNDWNKDAEGFRSSSRLWADCPVSDWDSLQACMRRLEAHAIEDGNERTSGRLQYHLRLVLPVDFRKPAPPPTCASVPRPLADTRTQQCPDGTVGTFGQTREFVEHPAQVYPDQCWQPGTTWTPTTSDACIPLPADCAVSDWSAWLPAECYAPAQQSRTRTVVTRPAHGGADCPALTETRACPEAPAPQSYSLYGPSTTGVYDADTSAVTLGVRFSASAPGVITAIRFYKNPQNTGAHTGAIFSANGQRLALATFTGETASGWQTARLATPLAIQANTTYVAAYHTTRGYAAKVGAFASPLVSGPLRATTGVYRYGSSIGFPSDIYQATSYFVDVVFVPGEPQPQPTTGSTKLSWTPPATNSNGTPLTDLAGYRLSYGTSESQLTQSVPIDDPNATSYVVEGLAPGTWHFGLRAVNAAGQVSELSNIASKTIP